MDAPYISYVKNEDSIVLTQLYSLGVGSHISCCENYQIIVVVCFRAIRNSIHLLGSKAFLSFTQIQKFKKKIVLKI